MHHATMILEGGATRGVFTSGILDNLWKKSSIPPMLSAYLPEAARRGLCIQTAGQDQRLYDPQREGIQLLSGSKKIFKRQKFIKYGYDL